MSFKIKKFILGTKKFLSDIVKRLIFNFFMNQTHWDSWLTVLNIIAKSYFFAKILEFKNFYSMLCNTVYPHRIQTIVCTIGPSQATPALLVL